MKKFTFLKGFLSLFLLAALTNKSSAQVASISPTNQSIWVGSSINFTGTAVSGLGANNDNKSFLYTVTGPAATTPAGPITININSGTQTSQAFQFNTAGVYTVTLKITQTQNGSATATTSTSVTVNTPVPVGCNGQYYISHGPTTGSTGNTLMDKLGFSGMTITPASFAVTPGSIGFNALGLNPIDGFMYAIRYPASGAKSHLLRIDAGGNQFDLGAISAMNNDEIAYAGCFDIAGTFYFMTTDNRFMKINNPVTSLSASLIATNTQYGSMYDIAINPVDGQMYGTSSSTTSNYLFTVNKTTGALSAGYGPNMGSSDFFAGLFFDEVGNLFGYRGDGSFFLINKATGALTSAGTASSYDGADGCSCSFGRVYHDLDFTANAGNQICPGQVVPNPTFPMTVTVTNQTIAQQTGLTYTLNMVDPAKRFRFTESAATIKANLITAGLATAASVVTLSTVAPATGTNYNKVVVTGFQTGGAASALSFTFQVQLYTLGGIYNPVPLQSEITGLVAPFGPNDLSNDPTSVTPDDATVITFCPNITLPVKLLSFTGTYKNNATLLNWVAENQINSAYYEIERSTDGSNFSSIGSKPSVGTPSSRENYQYNDNLASIPGNVFYYRLKMVDVDGQFKYSNIVMIQKNDKTLTGVALSPNPVMNAEATARVSATSKGTVNLSVVDMAGKVVLTQQNKVNEGVNSIAIKNLDRLQPGVYLLKVNNDGMIDMIKFTVIR